MAKISITQLLDDAQLLGPHYPLPNWMSVRVILKAVHGERLRGAELKRFHELFGDRAPPEKPVREVVGVCGRGFGKDSAAVADLVHASLTDYSAVLRPGAKATLLVCAVSKDQADDTLDMVKGLYSAVPMLRDLVVRETNQGLELANRNEVVIRSSNFRDAARGKTIPLAIINEAAYLPSEGSAAPDTELYRSLLPAMARIASSRLWIISSPYMKSGLLYDRFTRYFGKSDRNVLAFLGPSLLGNPTLDAEAIARALEDDPLGAPAEYLAQWRDGVSSFVGRALIEGLVDRDILVRAPVAGVPYHAFADGSSGAEQGDSFAVGIGHSEGDAVILDCIYERVPPFTPGSVVKEIIELLRAYGIGTVVGDRYSQGWIREAFAAGGMTYIHSVPDRSAIYGNFLPLATSGRARLLDNPRMISQFSILERVAGSGKEKIDHRRGHHDDISNVVAGCLTLAAAKPQEIPIFNPADVDWFSGSRPDPFAPNWSGSSSLLDTSDGLVRDEFIGTSAWLREKLREK
jgi:hypothetical protein